MQVTCLAFNWAAEAVGYKCTVLDSTTYTDTAAATGVIYVRLEDCVKSTNLQIFFLSTRPEGPKGPANLGLEDLRSASFATLTLLQVFPQRMGWILEVEVVHPGRRPMPCCQALPEKVKWPEPWLLFLAA